jgi:hypothetical protein
MLKYKILCIMKNPKNRLLFFCWLLLGNALALSNTIVDAAGVYTSTDIDRIGLKIAEVEAFHNIEIDLVTCTSALPQVGFVVSSTGLTGRKLLINIPAGVDVAGIQTSQDIVDVFPVSSLQRISEHVLRPLVESRDYCLATLETLESLLSVMIELESLFFEKSVEIEDILPSDAEWTFNNNVIESKLVAYPYQETMKIRPIFNAGAIADGISVKVIAQFGGNTVDKIGTISSGKIEFTNDTFELAPPVSSVDIVDEFKIDWYIELPDRPRSKIITTTSRIFFTLSKNTYVSAASYVGALNYTCKFAKGATNEAELIDLTWKNFSTRSLRTSMFFKPEDNVEDVPLTYYASPGSAVAHGCGIAFNVEYNRDGECGAFSDLFITLIETHGVEASKTVIAPTTYGEFFLVKKWSFNSQPFYPDIPYPYVNYVGLEVIEDSFDLQRKIRGDNNQYTFYEEDYPIDVRDVDGLPGQNVSNPYSDFFGHYNVQVGDLIYDPSYGTKHSSFENFEDSAIEAFGKTASTIFPDGRKVYSIILRKNKANVSDLQSGL